MPLNRNTPGRNENKKYIKENDVKGAVIDAIFKTIPDRVLEKLEYEIENAYSPFALVDKVARAIRKKLDTIVDLVISNLDLVRRSANRGQEIYYLDTLERKEIPFDVHLTEKDYKVEGKDPVDVLLEKSKDFLREVFGEDDLAEAFAYVFVEFVLTSDDKIFEKFTTEYEKEQAERRMKGFDERTKTYRKEKRRKLLEREPTERELREIEELGDVDKLSEEDLFTDISEDDFDDSPWDFPV
jgi:hypothetical protein